MHTSKPKLRPLITLVAIVLAALALAPSTSLASPAEDSAVSWAQAQEGSTNWDGMCLEFVYDAYAQAGVDISAQADDNSSAASYWDTYHGTKYPPSDTPPEGALVFWGPTNSNPYGHVVLAEGDAGGHAISTAERSYTGVHEMTIAYRNQQTYEEEGYVIPG